MKYIFGSSLNLVLYIHFYVLQGGVATACFYSRRVPRWAGGCTLALWRQPREPEPRENLHPPSAKPLCAGRERPARILDAVWWAVWAEDGLHPTGVQTSGSPPGSCLWLRPVGWALRVCLSTATSTNRTRPQLMLWPRSAFLLVLVWRTSQCC